MKANKLNMTTAHAKMAKKRPHRRKADLMTSNCRQKDCLPPSLLVVESNMANRANRMDKNNYDKM